MRHDLRVNKTNATDAARIELLLAELRLPAGRCK
jgi:hypothetical protein